MVREGNIEREKERVGERGKERECEGVSESEYKIGGR
jgi:hypothetical protein